MAELVRQSFVISDLHLGGAYGDQESPGDRGFRICTHADEVARFIDGLTARAVDSPQIELIVNGDLVDFLAERDEGKETWSPFTYDDLEARRKFEAIVSRDKIVFDALARFLAAGHRLVILLGNHDIELAMPAVRASLRETLGVRRGSDFEFIRDGEGYIVGDTLVEHGNRYDNFNIVNYEKLQRHNMYLSRGQRGLESAFEAPAGSYMVAHVINPIKLQYKFIDLLKPEKQAVIPMLLALEPGYRSILGRVALISVRAKRAADTSSKAEDISSAGSPRGGRMGGSMGGSMDDDDFGGSMASDISSESPSDVRASVATDDPQTADQALDSLLDETLGRDAQRMHSALDTESEGMASDISSGSATIDRLVGFAGMMFSKSGTPPDSRLDALALALGVLQNDNTFNELIETDQPTLDAARGLAKNGIKHVVFGHTHMAKRVPLPSGGFYLNSGTWADVMEFPRDVVTGSAAEVRARQAAFVEELTRGDFAKRALFRPTYVQIDLMADGTTSPSLQRWTSAT